MSNPRLVLLADAFDMQGGGEVVVAHLAGELRSRWDVAVITTTPGRDEVVDQHGIQVFRIHSSYHPRLRPFVSLANPAVLSKLAAIVRRLRSDVAHAWNVHLHLSYEALRRIRGLGTPIALTYQDAQPFCYSKFKCWLGNDRRRSDQPVYRAHPQWCSSCRQHYWLFPPRNRLVRSYLQRFVDRGVSVSAALAAALTDNDVQVDQVVHNGLPLQSPMIVGAISARARTRFGWRDDRLVMTGGRLHFFKGQRLAMETFARFAGERPNSRLVVFGKRDWFRDRLAEQADALGIGDRVSFPGFLAPADYFDALAAGDMFLNLSIYLDPFPTVNLEAMAMRMPVVGTCHGGTPEAVVNGETGYIVDPHQTDRVAELSARLLGDRKLRDSLGAAGRRRVEQQFTVELMAEQYESIYWQLIYKQERRPAASGARGARRG